MGFRRESAPLCAHWATGPLPTAHCPLPTARCPGSGVSVPSVRGWRRVGVSNTALGIQLDSHSHAKASTSHP